MILVFGKTGQVARELVEVLPHATFLDRGAANLSDPKACTAAILACAPDAVINAAAYTAVDNAEDDEPLAKIVNGEAPAAMARACADLGIPLVHISTDYVFRGNGTTPWKPNDPTGPLGAYGRSKLEGEEGIRTAGATYAILRTSWVFSAHGSNFVKTMLRLSETHDALNVVDDQIGGPTPAREIARACVTMAEALILDPDKSGTYHFSGDTDVSWADFARAIFHEAGRNVTVTGIPSSDYPTPAIRPSNSRLDCESLRATFGVDRPDWLAGLRDVLKELNLSKGTT